MNVWLPLTDKDASFSLNLVSFVNILNGGKTQDVSHGNDEHDVTRCHVASWGQFSFDVPVS